MKQSLKMKLIKEDSNITKDLDNRNNLVEYTTTNSTAPPTLPQKKVV